jgi:XTP/dITP diphosphohydrolase
MRVVLATRNAGKVREFDDLLGDLTGGVTFVPLDASAAEPDETGATFLENALLKARSAAAATGLPALADDSGLCVDALGGGPGVRSARYADGSDETRWQKLLRELEGVDVEQRTARFVCVLALVAPDGALLTTAEGVCEGRIVFAPRGEGGFGYDPVFEVADDDAGRTMAELTTAGKRAVSHRGRAFEGLRAPLGRLSNG